MQYRSLGMSGMEVSELSFGTVSLGIPYGIGVHGESDMPSEQESIHLLRAALDAGINFFDTARFYGKSEELIGRAFEASRDKVIICTKSAHLQRNGSPLPGGDEIKKIVNDSIAESLSFLRTDYVDVFMSHSGTMDVLSNSYVAEHFSELKRKGLARAIGVSTYSVEETQKAIESGVWDVVQLPYNLMDQRQSKIFSLAKQNGVGIVVRSALLKGILTDKGRNLHPKLKAVAMHRDKYGGLLNDKVRTLSDLATKFVLSEQEVSSVLLGIDRDEYLRQGLAVVDGKYLDEKTLTKARELAYPEPDFLDLPKWDKMGWLT